MGWYRYDPARRRYTVTVHVQPNARASAVAGLHGDALKVRIAAPATDGRANATLIDFLHQWFKLPASHLRIRHGARGRRKIVEIEDSGTDLAPLFARLEALCLANSSSK